MNLKLAQRMFGAALMAGTGALVSSCSFFVETSTIQCESNQECTDQGGAFEGTVCKDNACVKVEGASCASSQQCLDLSGTPSACIQGSCVSLISEDCQEVHPATALGDDSTIYIGWMGPLVGEFKSLGIPMKQAVQLALQEIDTGSNGIPAAGGGRRKLAMIACHDFDDPERTANHLVNNVKVPAIFGPAFSGITLDTATNITVQSGVLLISPSATSPLITDLPDDDLVWRTAPSDAIQAIPLAFLVQQVEASIRAELELSPGDDIVLATASKGDAYGEGLFNALLGQLTFNGKAASANGANFVPTSYDDPSDNPNFDFAPVVQEIVAATPNIVLVLGTNEGITKIMQGVEAAWPTAGSPPPRPFYLFPDGGRLDELLDATQGNEDLRKRVKGTVPGRKGDVYSEFAIRYKQAYSEDPGTFAENAYDSGYLMAYSIFAGGEKEVSGASIAAGLKKMSDKGAQEIKVGQNQLNTAFNVIQESGSIDFLGASGELDFDNNTGEAASDIDVWCVVVDSQTNKTVFVSSGQYYDATNDMLVGTDTQCL